MARQRTVCMPLFSSGSHSSASGLSTRASDTISISPTQHLFSLLWDTAMKEGNETSSDIMKLGA